MRRQFLVLSAVTLLVVVSASSANDWKKGNSLVGGAFTSVNQYAKGQTLAIVVKSLKPLGIREDKGEAPCGFTVNGKKYIATKRGQTFYVNLDRDGPVTIACRGQLGDASVGNELRFGKYENSARFLRWNLIVRVSLK